jgi:signal transduction histidine kinase
LLEAVVSVGADLQLASVLQRIVEVAVELVGARHGALGVLDETGTKLAEFITVGLSDEERAAIGRLPQGRGLLGRLIVDPRPLRVADMETHSDRYGFPPHHPPMRSFLGVPILVRERVFGNLYLTDRTDGDPFTEADEEMVIALATAAGVAIDNARLHMRVGELATFADRERIARDLHDTVIQRLFAIGLTLEGVVPHVEPRVGDRVQKAVDDLDETIRRIRASIFELETTRGDTTTLRRQLLDRCVDAGTTLGFEPVVTFDGPIDTAVDATIVAEHLLAVLNEALSNVAKHAAARNVSVDVAVSMSPASVTLTVTDDGRGPSGELADLRAGHGMRNMVARAESLRGSCRLEPRGAGGSVLTWQVPL